LKVNIYNIKNPYSCVSEIIEIKSDSSKDTLSHFVPPFGSPEIIFYFGQTHQIKNVGFANGAIKGLYNTSQKIDFVANYHFVTIRLKPYGLKQLFNFNATEILNSVIDIESHPITKLFSNLFRTRETLDVSFLKTLINSIEQYAIYPVSLSTKAFIKLTSESRYKTIKDLTLQNGIGQRTLQRNFKKEVGLSPKEYLRIKRLNAIEQKMSQNVDVFEIIADFDFSDQAHFIKDFKKLRSFTPTEISKKKLLLSDQLAIPEINPI
jgi:AraC-like DNA-binding protein